MFHSVLYAFRLLFFFTAPATTAIYTLSLHDALPISLDIAPSLCSQLPPASQRADPSAARLARRLRHPERGERRSRSEEHTSELQSQSNLVCRLLLEKKKKITTENQLLTLT